MNVRLEKLNAYLISKGKQPKPTGSVNFVKQNIGSLQKRKNSVLCESGQTPRSETQDRGVTEKHPQKTVAKVRRIEAKTPSKSRLQNTNPSSQSSTKIPRNKIAANLSKTDTSSSKINSVSGSSRILVPKPEHAKENRTNPAGTPKKLKLTHAHERTPSQTMRRKLVRRSIHNLVHRRTEATTPNMKQTPNAKFGTQGHGLQEAKKASCTPFQQRNSARKKMLPKSAGPRLTSKPKIDQKLKQNSGHNEEQIKIYEKLNNWLLSKGKKPLAGKKLRGFKAAKTIATPVASPAKDIKPASKNGSHWQGLRDEDENDEITILIRHTMTDVQNCLDEGCSPSILREMLEELAEKLPSAREQARYWLMLAQVEKKAGKSDEELFDLFERAVLAKAQPVDEIKEALKELVKEKVEGKPIKDSFVENQEVSWESKGEDIDANFTSITTNQSKTPNPVLERLIRSETPVLKNAATSPIVFESPVRGSGTPSSLNGSPSSTVKLRIVPKSSPVFNRLWSLRALPSDASAIVTPVRRSRRIAAAQESYPKSLQDHEPCLETVQELFPMLEGNSSTGTKSANIACDIVFDPNLALGEGYTDIATVLKF